MSVAALETRGLTVAYRLPQGGEPQVVVWGGDLRIERGKILGLAGESGCGKSTMVLAAIGYPKAGMEILAGESLLEGTIDLLSLAVEERRRYWGRQLAYVPQGASTALNPARTVGDQLAEPLACHLHLTGGELRRRQIELLEQVHLPDAERALTGYPHQFSGGQQQRISLAIAISCNPSVLVLDEPTTGLDVITQAHISGLLRNLVDSSNVGAVYVGHDLALLGSVTDRMAIMYAGEIVEEGPSSRVLDGSGHPYTRALLSALPDAHRPHVITGIRGQPPPGVIRDECPFAPRCPHAVDSCREGSPSRSLLAEGHFVRCIRLGELDLHSLPPSVTEAPQRVDENLVLEVSDLWCHYHTRSGEYGAVRGVSFEVVAGETLGIVGESGSGKSTLIRAIAGLHPPTRGGIRFQGSELEAAAVRRPRSALRDIQLVFQNPETSLNPRHTVAQIVNRPIRLFRTDITRSCEREELLSLLDAVKLPASSLHRYPGELSGGQRQRVALARAFAARPKLLLCDEVTSALDVSVQATILELIADLSSEFQSAVVFVSHDLAVVRTIADRALVMQLGEVCEVGRASDVFAKPRHPYTRELLDAVAPTSASRLESASVEVHESIALLGEQPGRGV